MAGVMRLATGALLLLVLVDRCQSRVPPCKMHLNCAGVQCSPPAGCLYGYELPPCACCPVCAQAPDDQQAQQEALPEGLLRLRRGLVRTGGTAQRLAKQHRHIASGGVPQEFLKMLQDYRRRQGLS